MPSGAVHFAVVSIRRGDWGDARGSQNRPPPLPFSRNTLDEWVNRQRSSLPLPDPPLIPLHQLRQAPHLGPQRRLRLRRFCASCIPLRRRRRHRPPRRRRRAIACGGRGGDRAPRAVHRPLSVAEQRLMITSGAKRGAFTPLAPQRNLTPRRRLRLRQRRRRLRLRRRLGPHPAAATPLAEADLRRCQPEALQRRRAVSG